MTFLIMWRNKVINVTNRSAFLCRLINDLELYSRSRSELYLTDAWWNTDACLQYQDGMSSRYSRNADDVTSLRWWFYSIMYIIMYYYFLPDLYIWIKQIQSLLKYDMSVNHIINCLLIPISHTTMHFIYSMFVYKLTITRKGGLKIFWMCPRY